MAASARWGLVLGLSAVLVSTLGCVTKGKYNDLESEKDQIAANRDDLQVQVDELEVTNDDLKGQLAATEQEIAALQGTYDGLVAELQGEVAAGQVEIQQLVDGIRLKVSDELLFPSGSAVLNDAGRSLITRVAGQLGNEDAIISVEGHTDNVGISSRLKERFPTNWELAGARAASVVRLLSEEGVDPNRLRAISRGPFAPVASNDTPEGRAMNRRTEIILRPIPR